MFPEKAFEFQKPVCYVVHNSKAVVVKADAFSAPDKETIKQLINDVIERLRT